MPIPIDAERQARSLYWRGWGISQIADELGLKRPTVEAWKQRKKWDEAIAYFNQAYQLDPKCHVAQIYAERAGLYQLNAPPEEWNGVFVMTSK